MVTPAAGAVVLVRFPFSDLSETKLRPAVVLADVGRGDAVLCEVTSKPYGDSIAVTLQDSDFVSGSLHLTSYACERRRQRVACGTNQPSRSSELTASDQLGRAR